jgi:hypothetical protein
MSEIFEKAYSDTEDHGLPLSVQADADIMRDGLDGAIAILEGVEGLKQSDNEKLALVTFALREIGSSLENFVDNCNEVVRKLKEENHDN